MGRSTAAPVEEETAAEAVNVSQRRVPGDSPGYLVFRALRGLWGDQVITGSKDRRGRRVTMVVVAPLVRKAAWECPAFLDSLETTAFLATRDKPGPGGSPGRTAVTGHGETQGRRGNRATTAHLVFLDNQAGRDRRETL